MNRRNFLVGFGFSSITTALNMRAHAASQTGSETTDMEPEEDDGLVELLFVQKSKGMRFENGGLTLVDVDPETLFFSDRPQDIAGYLSYEELVKLVGEGPDNFNEDPPNATLIVFGGDDLAEVVVELSEKPHVDGNNLIFPAVKIIAGTPPRAGGETALFIDTIGRPLSPVSVAGVHRRHRRRRAVRSPGPI